MEPLTELRGEAALVAALAAGRTVAEAAALSGVSERTAYRRKSDPHFQRRVDAARGELFERALGRLADGMIEAADTLVRNLAAPQPTVQVRAATAILDRALRLREATETERRLAQLEASVATEEAGDVAA